MYDEKKFGLDKKTDELMNCTDMNKTRSELLARVAADLEKAKRLQKQPSFGLQEMEDLL
jgi:glutaredoxin 2